MNGFTTYLILKLDTILDLLTTLIVFSGLLIFASIIATHVFKPKRDKTDSEENDNDYIENETYDWWIKHKLKFIITFIITIFLHIMIPNTKQAFAVYIIPKITSNQTIIGLPEKLSKLLDLKIKDIQ